MSNKDEIKDKVYLNLGRQLQTARISRGVTLQEGAELVRTSSSTLPLLEAGDRRQLSRLHLGEWVSMMLRYGKIPTFGWEEPMPWEVDAHLNNYSTETLRRICDYREAQQQNFIPSKKG